LADSTRCRKQPRPGSSCQNNALAAHAPLSCQSPLSAVGCGSAKAKIQRGVEIDQPSARSDRPSVSGVLLGDPVAICAGCDGPYPLGIVQIPHYCGFQPVAKTMSWLPPQLAGKLSRIDRVAAVMPRAIGDEGDLIGIGAG